MAWYSPDRRIRRRQIGMDAGLAAWIAVWGAVAAIASRAIRSLTSPLRSAVQSVEALRDNIHQAAIGASGLPVGGGALRPPLDAASTDANGLVAALNDQIRAIELGATGVAIALVVVPLLLFLCWWLPRRLRTTKARGSDAADKVVDPGKRLPAVAPARPASRADTDITPEQRLAALRGLVGADASLVLGISADPVGDWARGDPAVVERLSALASGFADPTDEASAGALADASPTSPTTPAQPHTAR